MAYSDYGGYAYRNGLRVIGRSDCTIGPYGDDYGSPGVNPDECLSCLGLTPEAIEKCADWPSGHVVLGDGPVYVVLRKTYASVYRGAEILSDAGVCRDWDDPEDHFCHTLIDGCSIDIKYTEEDNYYVYAKITQPDGTVWTGFSGYHVGAGFEEEESPPAYPCYNTQDRINNMNEIFKE